MRSDLTLSSVNLQILKLSTTEITEIWLSPFMAKRIAAMLNFFLRHLTGEGLLPLPCRILRGGDPAGSLPSPVQVAQTEVRGMQGQRAGFCRTV